MCGILGLWNSNKQNICIHAFNQFIDSLAHRGPDGRGHYHDSDNQLALGHRRLAILDLSKNGSQPMSYANGRFWITFNGEIYNFLELQEELKQLGHTFRSHSDTEVILASYAEWGANCQNKFNGMWAFAIWDTREKQLFLSRDRFGVKPLFYYQDQHRFVLASELKAFLKLPEIPIEYDPQLISDTLFAGNSAANKEDTFITGIKQLKGGHCAVINCRGNLHIQRWWNTCAHLTTPPPTWEGQVEHFRELLIDACKIRMRSDVPLGCAVSGGLDSSAILAIMSKIAHDTSMDKARIPKEWHHAFFAQYINTSQDEYVYAKEVIKQTKATEHLCTINSKDLVHQLDKAIFDFEEIVDLPIGPWLLYRELRKNNIPISIDGHGADELLGGYHHHLELAMEDAIIPHCNVRRFSQLSKMVNALYPEGSPHKSTRPKDLLKKAMLRHLRQHPLAYRMIKSFLAHIKKNYAPYPWLRNIPNHPLHRALENFPSREIKGLNRSLYIDFHSITLPTILRNFDRASMAHGIEIRSPFLDHRLVTYAFSLKSSQTKIGGGFTKRILREATKGIVPELIRTRQSKIGFASPMTEWFKGDLKPFILDQISSQSFLTSPYWNGPKIKSYVEKCYETNHIAGARLSWEYVQAHRLLELFKK